MCEKLLVLYRHYCVQICRWEAHFSNELMLQKTVYNRLALAADLDLAFCKEQVIITHNFKNVFKMSVFCYWKAADGCVCACVCCSSSVFPSVTAIPAAPSPLQCKRPNYSCSKREKDREEVNERWGVKALPLFLPPSSPLSFPLFIFQSLSD